MRVAAVVVDILHRFFPQHMDRLPRETAFFEGPGPLLLSSLRQDDLSVLLSASNPQASQVTAVANTLLQPWPTPCCVVAADCCGGLAAMSCAFMASTVPLSSIMGRSADCAAAEWCSFTWRAGGVWGTSGVSGALHGQQTSPAEDAARQQRPSNDRTPVKGARTYSVNSSGLSLSAVQSEHSSAAKSTWLCMRNLTGVRTSAVAAHWSGRYECQADHRPQLCTGPRV